MVMGGEISTKEDQAKKKQNDGKALSYVLKHIFVLGRNLLKGDFRRSALLAQSVARVTLNHKVRGSSPLQG